MRVNIRFIYMKAFKLPVASEQREVTRMVELQTVQSKQEAERCYNAS